MLSRFLPEDFDPTRPVAVIAGQRSYPVLTVSSLRREGVPVRLIAFDGETEPSLFESFPASQRARIKVGQLGHMLSALKELGAASAIMAGQISPGKLFRGLHPDFKAVSILARLKERNAESIFGAIASEIELIGVRLLDARCFLDDQMAVAGPMTHRRLKESTALEHGITIAMEVARLDIGQGVVVSSGTVLAVEAFEGTDEMLRRAGRFGARSPLFVKTVKPRQDYRFDVPVFGLRTLEVLKEAKIQAVALHAGGVLILDKAQVLQAADSMGVILHGFLPETG